MFIGIAGPICSGKRTIADFLISNHNFKRLRLRPVDGDGSSTGEFEVLTPAATPPVDEDTKLSNGLQKLDVNAGDDISFKTMSEMVDYVTKRWRENFVTVDIWKEEHLEMVVKRPFFLLVSVDAPISVRWKRFNERYIFCRYILMKMLEIRQDSSHIGRIRHKFRREYLLNERNNVSFATSHRPHRQSAYHNFSITSDLDTCKPP
jgi:hypothetical protein